MQGPFGPFFLGAHMYFSIHYENGPYSYEVTINTESSAEQVLTILDQFASSVLKEMDESGPEAGPDSRDEGQETDE
jgi:hypothetical protein